ncbi:uncharacterized protein LOC116124192 [Pistacia vera]|uniref:uncharacterized protein LOC116124192 n=1 Tax=Pistacia vera TaxID=55513 RepID=UPI001262C98F|nr:uncharacterized protein LOC116124192 [Pistacia vera]
MQLEEADLKPTSIPLYGCTMDHLIPKGTITLPATLGETHEVTKMTKFLVVDCLSTFNGILGRPLRWNFKVVTSIYHLKIRFPTPTGCGEVKGSQRESHDCYVRAVQMAYKGKGKPVGIPKQTMAISRIKPQPGLVEDSIDPRVQEEYSHSGLVETLSKTHADMVGISPNVIWHALNIDSEVMPVRQKRRVIDLECYVALKVEVDKLLSLGFIRVAHYSSWVTNLVLVKKPNGKWQTCVDFTDLNKACSKESFLLPIIDQLVDATFEHELLSFMDA